MSDLLFEIGTEELPAGFLNPAAEQLENLFTKKVAQLKLPYDSLQTFATPRRLAVVVTGLVEGQENRREELIGPSKQAAFDSGGNPTKAAEGFARSRGVAVSDLAIIDTPKGEYLQLVREVKGEATDVLLPSILKEIILELAFAKSMKWGTYHNTFARPIQWIVALFGDKTIVFEHDGIVAGRKTAGHRFMAPESMEIASPALYEETMESLSVVADFSRRRELVLSEINKAAAETDFQESAQVFIDQGLLDTVTNLVEKPFGVCGHFEDTFLQLPDDVLITSMREHQKYFPVINGNGTLLPGFVAVNNTEVSDTAITRQGHERVLRARLEDAFFFFESDRKTRLHDRLDKLSGIIFQAKLGSMREKTERIVKLTRLIAEIVDPTVTEDACRAALLCKADLITDMVGEFPSLQGVMGGAYAKHDQENDTVVQAIKEHYMPLRSGAELPSSSAAAIVGLADRLDTIAGCFGIGQQPTGTADPFGLRRLSIAVLHIIRDRGYTLLLPEIVQKALALYGQRVDGGSATVDLIISFIKGRFVNDCVGKGMDSRAVDSVTSVVFTDVNDSLDRIAAFSKIKRNDSFAVLAGSFKRIRNIVKDNQDTFVREELFSEAAEQNVWSVFKNIEQGAAQRLQQKDYYGFLESMLALKDPVDRFFDDVMVMAEDEHIRMNRLNLLTAIGSLILEVGDISRMHVS